MAFIRCKKHPDIVMHSATDGKPGLRCRVCEEVRPLQQELRDVRMVVAWDHYADPGHGRCMCCSVCRAEGHIELLTGRKLMFCRSCLGIVRGRMKSLFKSMEQRARELNERRSR
jgi:hypothetical protein